MKGIVTTHELAARLEAHTDAIGYMVRKGRFPALGGERCKHLAKWRGMEPRGADLPPRYGGRRHGLWWQYSTA